MAWFEPLIIIGAITFVGTIIFLHFYMKKKGKSLGGDCSHNCSCCSHKCSNAQQMLEEYHKCYYKK